MRFAQPRLAQILSTILACLLGISFAATSHADWLSFRGQRADGVADSPAPAECQSSSIRWQVDLPGRSVSSPIVVGGQVIVTASSGVEGDRLHVISLDATTGKQRWQRQYWATGRSMCHETSANAAPSPISDGDRIVAFFSSNDVICLDLAGRLQWFRGLAHDFPKAGNDIGMSSSPILANGVVVCQVENQGDSFAIGLSAKDGTTLWRRERPKAANWTSPVHLPGENVALLKSSAGVSAHNLQTGKVVWELKRKVGGIPTIVATQQRIYVPGSTFLALDRGQDKPTVAWDSKKLSPSPSMIATGDRFYLINSAGVLSAHSAENGDVIWRTRVRGKYWASPVLAGEHIYTINHAGVLTIVTAADGKKVDTHDFEVEVLGTPAVSDGALFVRSVDGLYRVD